MFSKIKKFILKLIIYFLPRPKTAPAGEELVTEQGVKKIIRRLFDFLSVGIIVGTVFTFLRHFGVLQPVSTFLTGAEYASNFMTALSVPEVFLFTLALIYFIAMPYLRYVYKWLPVTGAIYALQVGILITCGISIAKLHLIIIITAAIAGTALLTLLPLYLLRRKKLKLPKYFARITQISFAVVTLGDGAFRALDQIPFIRALLGHSFDISKFSGVLIAADALKVILAFLFMFLAYDRMRDYIQRRVSRRYEWLVAFTGFYTLGVIVVKISEMLVLIFE